MELQWPLILFTSFVAASAGLFAVQGCYALSGKGQKAQLPATIASIVLLAVGGIAVFFHLTHPDRIFNGFGHMTSGITQELIAIVIVLVLMVLFFVFARQGGIPKWLGILAIIGAMGLIAVMGHSYMVDSRPAWNSYLQPLSLIGIGWAFGAGAFAALDAAQEEDHALHGPMTLVCTALGAVCTAIYAFAMGGAANSFTSVGNYFDPTHPTYGMVDIASFNPMAGANAGITIGAVAFAISAFAFALWGKSSKKWNVAGWAIAACACVSAILLRMAFYNTGGSVFLFY